MKKIIKRLRNKKILTAVIASVLMSLTALDVISYDVSERYQNALEGLLTALVVLGILTNPDE